MKYIYVVVLKNNIPIKLISNSPILKLKGFSTDFLFIDEFPNKENLK